MELQEHLTKKKQPKRTPVTIIQMLCSAPRPPAWNNCITASEEPFSKYCNYYWSNWPQFETKLYPENSEDEQFIYRRLLNITSALFQPLTSASHHAHSYEKLSVEADELMQPSRMMQNAEVLPAPFPAFSLPCLVGEEGTYVPLVTAVLYVCATNGRSWDADSRISLAGSMLPSSLPSRERLAGEVICLDITQLSLTATQEYATHIHATHTLHTHATGGIWSLQGWQLSFPIACALS